MNDDNTPKPPDTDTVPMETTPEPPPPSQPHPPEPYPMPEPMPPGEPRLQREAVVLVHDRGRFAVLVALCTLAGVAVGFVLGTFAGSGTRGDAADGARTAAYAVDRPSVGVDRPHCDHDDAMVMPHLAPDPSMLLRRHGIDIWNHDPQAWLGVNMEDNARGARVTGVVPGSAAAAAGIEVGDVITAVDGESIATASQLARAIRNYEPGDDVTVKLERNGDDITLEAELGSRGGSQGIRIR